MSNGISVLYHVKEFKLILKQNLTNPKNGKGLDPMHIRKLKIILINIISLLAVIFVFIVSQLDWQQQPQPQQQQTESATTPIITKKEIEWSGISTRGIQIEKALENTTVPEEPSSATAIGQ